MNLSDRRKGLQRIAVILLGVILIMNITGCGGPKYKLEYDGYGFKSKKTEYQEGEKVTVYYDLIGTDTDYWFSLDCDDVKLKQDWDNTHGYIFTFTMPAHDVKISVSSRNSMDYDPDASDHGPVSNPVSTPVTYNSDLQTETWFCPECGAKNDMLYCKDCGLKKPE